MSGPRALLMLLSVQAGWFACVLGAASGRPLAGCLVVVALVLLHVMVRPSRAALVGSLVSATLIGAMFDGALTLAGVLHFPARASLGWPTPAWMLALWANFALVLEDMSSWLRRSSLAAALGAVGGPLTYLAAGRLGAISLESSETGPLAAVAVEWAVAMPILLMSDRLIRQVRR